MKRLLFLLLSFIISGMSLQGSEAGTLDDGYQKRVANYAAYNQGLTSAEHRHWLLKNLKEAVHDGSPSTEIPYAYRALKQDDPKSVIAKVLGMKAININEMMLNALLLESGFKGFNQLIQLLPTMGADINVRSQADARTPLMYSSMVGNTETCKALLKQGADVDAQDRYGDTSLVFAAVQHNIPTMQLLIQHKADTGHDVSDKYISGMKGLNKVPNPHVISLIQQHASPIGQAPKSPPARDESPVHARSL